MSIDASKKTLKKASFGLYKIFSGKARGFVR